MCIFGCCRQCARKLGQWVHLTMDKLNGIMKQTLIIVLMLLGSNKIIAQKNIGNYVFFNIDRHRIQEKSFLETKKLVGAQLKYTWKELEPEKDQYDFSEIEKDLDFLINHNKKLFIQLQDVTFDTIRVFVPRIFLPKPSMVGELIYSI